MSDANAAQIPEPGGRSTPHELATTLLNSGPTQVGGMVTSIILVGQATSQFSQTVAPYIAFLFSCLLAIYQVKVVEKAKALECCIMIPMAALILFALSLGGNNSIGSMAEKVSSKKLELIKEQLQLRTKELTIARQSISDLRQILGLPPSPLRPRKGSSYQPGGSPRELAQTQGVSTALNFLIEPALAQPSENTQPSIPESKRQKVLETLRAYDEKRKDLQQEAQRLKEKREQLREEKKKNPQPTPLWRKW